MHVLQQSKQPSSQVPVFLKISTLGMLPPLSLPNLPYPYPRSATGMFQSCRPLNPGALPLHMQPSSEVFSAFDDLVVLAEGAVAYHGEVRWAGQRALACGPHPAP